MWNRSRVNALQQSLKENTLLCVTRPSHLKYLFDFDQLTPYELESFALISRNYVWVFHAAFTFIPYYLPVISIELRREWIEEIFQLCTENNLKSICVDLRFTTAEVYRQLETLQQKSPSIEILPEHHELVMNQRIYKDSFELEALQRANRKTKECLQQSLSELQVGMTEKDFRSLLHRYFRSAGMEELAFPTIVAFGEHSALPHHQPTDKRLEANMPVLIDCGGKIEGYCADVTRTIWFGETPTPLFLQLEKIVKNAHSSSVQKLDTKKKPSASQLDATARSLIEEAGYGRLFIHTLGHGVGLDVHEPPSLNNYNQQSLQPNMCLTIEPGIYIEGEFGYRHEDSFALTENGCQLL